MKQATEVEANMIDALSKAIACDAGSVSTVRKIGDILEDILCITSDQNKLANAQIDEENHLHSLSSKKGINFRE